MLYHSVIMMLWSLLKVPPDDDDDDSVTQATAQAARRKCIASAHAVVRILQLHRTRWGIDYMSTTTIHWVSMSLTTLLEELDSADPTAFTIRTVPDRLRSTGDPWESMGEQPGSIAPLLEWWARDLENGEGELPFPPDFPKMPGEPPRVQPSRARKA